MLLLALLAPVGAFGDDVTPAEIQALIASGRLEGARRPSFAGERPLLSALYASVGYAPLWLDDERPSARARAAIGALGTVAAKGLEASDYDADLIADAADRLSRFRRPPPSDRAQLDVALSLALVRLLSDLALGRVDAAALGFDYDGESKRAALAALVASLATAESVPDVLAAAEPPLLERRLLEQQLARYRRLADAATVAPAIAPTVRPGAPLAEAGALAAWLAALGDLQNDAFVPGRYEGPLVEAVQRFQFRHGLPPDGVIGAATAGALAVPAVVRARQITLALERLRWLPQFRRDRALIVNVPGFELVAFEEIGSGRLPTLGMPVVVGRALRTQTPFFAGTMTSVVFAPYWNVPTSILRKEILPKLRTKPGYLAAEEMEVVSAGRVLPLGADAVARLAHGSAELRQRPGPKNALGRVKFLFPNPYHVYMHDTPAHELFGRSRRDFSHGCIRLADAPALAHWVLGGEGWEPARVDEMLAATRETSFPLRRPIAVLVAYATAVARPDGTIDFYDDIYAHDAELEQALAERAARR